jgi:hypothetical protein
MWRCAVRAAAVAVAFGVLWNAGPAQAALLLTGPTQVAPGASFEVTLSLNEALTPTPPDVLDLIDIKLTYDPAALQLGPATKAALLDDPNNIDVVPGEAAHALFLVPPSTFGPGDLLVYRFTALAAPNSQTTLSVLASPMMLIDGEGNTAPIADWAPATATVQIVPEPSSWLLLAAGLGCLLALRARGQPTRDSSRVR